MEEVNGELHTSAALPRG